MGLFSSKKKFYLTGFVRDTESLKEAKIGDYIKVFIGSDGSSLVAYLKGTVGGQGYIQLSGSHRRALIRNLKKGGDAEAKIEAIQNQYLNIKFKLISQDEVVTQQANQRDKQRARIIKELNIPYKPQKPFTINAHTNYKEIPLNTRFSIEFKSKEEYLSDPLKLGVFFVDENDEYRVSEISATNQIKLIRSHLSGYKLDVKVNKSYYLGVEFIVTPTKR